MAAITPGGVTAFVDDAKGKKIPAANAPKGLITPSSDCCGCDADQPGVNTAVTCSLSRIQDNEHKAGSQRKKQTPLSKVTVAFAVLRPHIPP